MAGGQERILRGRIRSVQATKKITRAMELIAASRIVKAQLERGYRLVELLKQPLNSPMPVAEQVVSIFAGTNGYLDDIPADQVRPFEDYLLEQFRSRYASMLDEIRLQGTLPGGLADAVANVKAGFTTGARAGGVTADPLATQESAVPPATTDKTLETE